jgi:ABC-type antimicrobial peptide transport system permease subunit
LFAALLLGVVLASTFFAGINISADTAAKQALDQLLNQVPVDIVVRTGYGFTPIISKGTHGLLSPDNATELANLISNSGIEGIADTEVISRDSWMIQLPDANKTTYFQVAGISENSCVYDGLTLTEGSLSLGANETYVWADSPEASDLKIGDVLSANFSVWLRDGYEPEVKWLTVNFTVVGFVELDSKASLIALGHYYYYPDSFGLLEVVPREYDFKTNLLIADWNKTFAGLLDAIYAMSPPHISINTDILVFLDREAVVGPWSIDTAIDKLRTITSQINNKVLDWGAYAENYLESVLDSYQFIFQTMRFEFLRAALPVFFMAWYMGTTVSDVSLNLRKREIGLLLTKGLSRGQLLRMFLSEAALIALIGGLIGIGLSLLLNPFFVTATGGRWFSGAPVFGTDTAILVVIFSVAITFLSIFRPARRASQLQAIDALREYTYVEEVKPYKKRWPWVALFLGTYKITMWLSGTDLAMLMMRPLPTTNILLLILLGIWIFFDVFILNYIGPILFFWGLTKILIHGSLMFQELTTKAARFLGDLGSLATKNVQRNPTRVASIAFLIALIIAYSFQATGAYASKRDHTIRQIKYNIGADVSVQLTTLTNASQTMSEIENLPEVSSTVLEYSFSASSALRMTTLRAADPEKWLETAYYERELFTGNDVTTAFHQMAADNDTIILERETASMLNLDVGDTIALTFDSEVHTLEVVGFFGPKPHEDQYYRYDWIPYYSYVPQGLYNLVEDKVSATGRILVKLVSGVSGKSVADQIRELETENIGTVQSVEEQLQEWQSNPLLSGPLSVQLIGVAFAVVIASIGTALVTSVSLRERSREVSIMSVRGLSFKQLVTTLLAENLAVVVFAVLLGTVVGLIWVRGNVVAADTASYSIIAHHMVFPTYTLLTLFACFVFVFASTVIPVIVMARRYVSRLERMVR